MFPIPNCFDIGRQPNPHLAFGAGPHLCIGATLTRLEARGMFEEFISRWTDVELAGPVQRTHSNFVSDWKSIPLRSRPR